MRWINTLRTSDLRGFSRMARTAALEVTDVVEALHATFGAPWGAAHRENPGRTRGITGAVYGVIRGATHLLGTGMETALALSERRPASTSADSSPEREAILAALNGVWGDELAAEKNPLAIPMALRSAGRTLPMHRETLAQVFPHSNGRILLLAHGLCMNDLQWSRFGHDHGAALATAFGYTPLYLHYNSGLHISSNGRTLSALLSELVGVWPHPVEEIVILTHSMGGLVARSACHYAAEESTPWLRHLRKVVCMGTPHHGSPLERGGNLVDVGLGATPVTAPFQRLGQRRSAGITDLRYGNLVDEDWHGIHRFHPLPDMRRPVPLTEGIQWYAMAAAMGDRAQSVKTVLMGDGLVRVQSALGQHPDPARTLHFPPEHQWVGHGMNHTDLLWKPEVCDQVGRWLADG